VEERESEKGGLKRKEIGNTMACLDEGVEVDTRQVRVKQLK